MTDVSDIYESMSPGALNNLARPYFDAYGGTAVFPNMYANSRDQFHKLNKAEPYSIERRSVDNPKFLWPSDQYMDSAGNSGKVQRGYMRSLLSDPQVDVNHEMKNRRLFFQFNPQVLVRSVQQTPGAMNPLLQDPAQLMQPVPGTTSFGFELMFNREHEVNAGYNDPDREYLHLPNGDLGLVSEIGVLADLLILDSITGQGLSEDMINAVVNKTKRDYQNINEENAAAKQELTDAGVDVETADYEPIVIPGDDKLNELFTANIGNAAFLNPQPFRVLFSTLFMVEGVATSVDVVFQKFSRTMVPTQCKVTINMYALYLGFAKEKTFIFDNLRQSASDQRASIESDNQTTNKFALGVEKFSSRFKTNSTPNGSYGNDFPAKSLPYFEVFNIEITKELKKLFEDGELKEANFSFDLEYAFTTTNEFNISEDVLKQNRITLAEDGKKVNFNAKGTREIDGKLYALLNNSTDRSIFQGGPENTYGKPINNRFITWRIVMVVHATSATGTELQKDIYGSTVYNAEWTAGGGGEKMNLGSNYTYTAPTIIQGAGGARLPEAVGQPNVVARDGLGNPIEP